MYYQGQDPKWLLKASRHLRWLAIPNIAVIFITLQILGFFSISTDPVWFERLALFPEAVLNGGQVWRLLTFLSLPVSSNLIWFGFALWFLYFVINLIESRWGEFKTTLYFLVSIAVTIAYSLVTGYPVTSVQDLSSSLFLAAAALFPELEVRLYFAIPVKLKWLGWLSLAFLILRFLQGNWLEKFYLMAIYSSYLLFFGPALLSQIRQYQRRREYRSKLR